MKAEKSFVDTLMGVLAGVEEFGDRPDVRHAFNVGMDLSQKAALEIDSEHVTILYEWSDRYIEIDLDWLHDLDGFLKKKQAEVAKRISDSLDKRVEASKGSGI